MVDEELKKRLNNSGYKNWLKVSRALIESKEALHDFTETVIVDVHNDIKSRLGTGECTKTSACNTKKGAPTCVSCKQWMAEIKTKRCDGMLNWKNANPQIWHNTPWEIAKCFMNDQGSKTNANANTGPAKTDLSGLLNVLVNCKEFKLKHLKGSKNLLPKDVRKVRNELMHCATMSFTDAEMQDMIDKVIALLEDDKELKHLPICQEKVELIKSLRNSELELKPVDESECIRTALEAHAFAVESGEEVDEGMKLLYEKLIELIRGNKDLERKFDEKIKKMNKQMEKMKQDSDAQFEEVHVILGELRGQVQSLLLQSSTSSTTACSTLGHSEMKSFYKNALQSYAQRRKLDLPKYTNEVKGGKYVSTVLIGEKKFKSKEPKQSKREADQSAAEEALRNLGNEDSELLSEKNKAGSTEQEQTVRSEILQPKDKLNYKNLLQEKAQKKKILNPIYSDKNTDAGFISEVMYNGKWYSPEVDPQSRKVDAQQKAAQFVLAVVDSEEEKQELSSSNPPLSMQSQGDIGGKEMNSQKNMSKSFRVILNEHVQKVKKGLEIPDYKEEKDLDGKFLCKVTVFGKVYESLTGKNSISDARESAANKACIDLQLVEAVPRNLPRAANLEEERVPSVVPISDEVDSGARKKISSGKETNSGTPSTNISPVDRPVEKTYKSMLHEYAQKMGEKSPVYEEISGTEFRCKVKVCGKTFECVENQPSKKKSKEMAAREAMKYFDGLSSDDSSKANDDTSAVFCTKMKPRNVQSETEEKETTTRKNLVKESEEEPHPSAESLDASPPEVSKYFQNLNVETKNDVPSKKSDAQQIPIPTQKSPQNFKSALQEYVKKRKFEQDIRYATKQDPLAKTYVGKVFVGKRCFKGKQSKAKAKEADKHVAEIALNALEGRNCKPDAGSEQLLNEYHKDLGFSPAFPDYKATASNDEYSAEVKVKRKYEFVCNDTKPKKKDVELWLAEQAVKLLEEEKRISPGEGNAKSRLNLFLQSQDGDSNLKYNVKGDQGKFSGDICFYVVDLYESLVPQPTKEEAIASAAMSACNALDLLEFLR